LVYIFIIIKKDDEAKNHEKFSAKLFLQGQRKTYMPGPGLDIDAYIFSFLHLNHMLSSIPLPHFTGGETNP
jgi:hypothetical protein